MAVTLTHLSKCCVHAQNSSCLLPLGISDIFAVISSASPAHWPCHLNSGHGDSRDQGHLGSSASCRC